MLVIQLQYKGKNSVSKSSIYTDILIASPSDPKIFPALKVFKRFFCHEIQPSDFFSRENVKSSNIFELDKIYLLNIWSSWCVPCRQEHPFLMNINTDNKVNIIGINYKDNLKNAENFLKELGNPYKEIFIDLDGTLAIEWGAYGVPESFLIHNNEIIKKYIGPLNQKLVDEINLFIK